MLKARRDAGDAALVRPPRRRSAPTMRDIGEETGVSQSTVSRVLSGAPTTVPIAERTRSRVLEAADRLGYRPNPLARGLRGASTMLLGVIVRDITDPFFAVAIEAASLEANRRGYNVVLGHAHQSADEAVALASILEARHCDAILFLGDLRARPDLIADLQDSSVPVVAVWHGSRDHGMPTVSVDNAAGIDAVMDHLVQLGHARIAFAGPNRLGDITEREAAYSASLQRHRLPVIPGYRIETENTFAGGRAALTSLIGLAEPPTAFVASTDVIAMGMLHEADRRGLKVPGDVSVSGFDDIAMAGISVPALTTVSMPTAEMMTAAIDLAIGDAEASHPVLAPQLVIRASTGPLRATTSRGD